MSNSIAMPKITNRDEAIELRGDAIEKLCENAKKVSREKKSIVLGWEGIVQAATETGEDGYIPGYIPYIGKNYFSKKTKEARILIYALSQNMKPDHHFVKKLADHWSQSDCQDKALNRQNANYESGLYIKDSEQKSIMMHPFDTGHLPVIAAMLLNCLGKEANAYDSIYDIVAATNLSKYSFRKKSGKTCDSQESLNKCIEWFTRKEIKMLKPDYIICAGNQVYKALNRDLNGIETKLIKVAFPSLLVINRWHKELEGPEVKKERILGMIPKDDHEKEIDYKGKVLEYVVNRNRDAIYFSNMYNRMRNVIAN